MLYLYRSTEKSDVHNGHRSSATQPLIYRILVSGYPATRPFIYRISVSGNCPFTEEYIYYIIINSRKPLNIDSSQSIGLCFSITYFNIFPILYLLNFLIPLQSCFHFFPILLIRTILIVGQRTVFQVIPEIVFRIHSED